MQGMGLASLISLTGLSVDPENPVALGKRTCPADRKIECETGVSGECQQTNRFFGAARGGVVLKSRIAQISGRFWTSANDGEDRPRGMWTRFGFESEKVVRRPVRQECSSSVLMVVRKVVVPKPANMIVHLGNVVSQRNQ